jgi:hypothetical protein
VCFCCAQKDGCICSSLDVRILNVVINMIMLVCFNICNTDDDSKLCSCDVISALIVVFGSGDWNY